MRCSSFRWAEFTGARNTRAARLENAGPGDVGGVADLVKALVKPSISAWTVNQLYWKHREVFDRLIESGVRFHKAQSSGSAGKLADMRTALDLQSRALTQLSDPAGNLIAPRCRSQPDAGH